MNHPKNDFTPVYIHESPWKKNDNIIWLGSTFSLKRNIEKIPFPHKLSSDKKRQIRGLLLQTLSKSKEFSEASFIPIENTSPWDNEYIIEHFLLPSTLHQSEAEAFVINPMGSSLAIINFEDHLHLMNLDTGEELSRGFDRLLKTNAEIAKLINFAFSQKFGYLTANPGACGTALRVTVFLHLPAILLKNKLKDFSEQNKEAGIIFTGFQSNPNEFMGDIVALHNRYTCGVSEEQILSSLQTAAAKLIAEEKGLRQAFRKEYECEVPAIKDQSFLLNIRDKVNRAYAILMYSYQIEVVEALQEVSWIKLGLDLGWIKGASQASLNHLFFALRHAHLLRHYDQKPSQEELPHRRAEYIHKELKDLTLIQ